MRGGDPSRYLAWLREETAGAAGVQLVGTEALEEALIHPRLLIVGGAGCGKTTFLRQLAFLWCCGLQDARTYSLLFPIFLRLPEVAAHIESNFGRRPRESPEWLIDFLDARSRELSWDLSADFFRQKLAGSFLLLDGLNDSPGWMARLVENAAAVSRHCRILVTSRPSLNGVSGFRSVRIGRG